MANFITKERQLRDIKVKRLRDDAKNIVDNLYMDFADDQEFVSEMITPKRGAGMNMYYFDFSHISEGAFHEEKIRIPDGLVRLIFKKQVNGVNKRLI